MITTILLITSAHLQSKVAPNYAHKYHLSELTVACGAPGNPRGAKLLGTAISAKKVGYLLVTRFSTDFFVIRPADVSKLVQYLLPRLDSSAQTLTLDGHSLTLNPKSK